MTGTRRAAYARMPSWTEISTAVAERWRVGNRSATALLLVVDSDGQRQKVLVEAIATRAGAALIVVADVASARLYPSDRALEYNATAEVGALAFARGMLVLRQQLPLDALTVEDALRAIDATGGEARRLRRLIVRPSEQNEVSRVTFEHLAD